MTSAGRRPCSRASVLIATVLIATALGCGDDFENEPRDPVPLELTGVIKQARVTISPDRVGAGPIAITISNQTDAAHTVTLQGNSVREEVGPINPQDTATIQKTVPQGTYQVRASSDDEGPAAIRPATLRVGRPRPPSNDRILLP